MTMSDFYVLEPEVAGGLGPNTVMDRNVHPPVVTKLHYEFDGWLGDEIVESFPCFLVTETLSKRFAEAAVAGGEFAPVEITRSERFREANPGLELPCFVWLKLVGRAGVDDLGVGPDHRLVVSKKVLDLIESTSPRGLDVEVFTVGPNRKP
jgi:hypothetical protein